MKTRYKARDFAKLSQGTKLSVYDHHRPVAFSHIQDDYVFVTDGRHEYPVQISSVEQIIGRQANENSDSQNSKKKHAKNKSKDKPLLHAYFWKVKPEWYLVMSLEQVAVWTVLNNKLTMLQDNKDQPLKGRTWTRKGKPPKPLKEYWFYFTHKMMQEDLGISSKVQDRIIGELKKEKLLKTKKISVSGRCPTRHFRLCTKRLENRIQKAIKRNSQPRTK